MDAQTKADVARYLTSLVNETVRHGSDGAATATFNERTLYGLPADENELVLLLRQAHGPKPSKLWASRCTLPVTGLNPVPDVPQDGTFSCR